MPCSANASRPGTRRLAAILRAALLALAIATMVAGCADHSGRLQIVDVHAGPGAANEMRLRIQLPATLRRGLQRGVHLSWRLDVEREHGRDSHWRELRYSPLSGQYQLREPALGYSRSYPSRSAALAALERWPLPPGSTPRSLRVRLDTARLPAPLVLPALFDADWRMDSGHRPVPR